MNSSSLCKILPDPINYFTILRDFLTFLNAVADRGTHLAKLLSTSDLSRDIALSGIRAESSAGEMWYGLQWECIDLSQLRIRLIVRNGKSPGMNLVQYILQPLYIRQTV